MKFDVEHYDFKMWNCGRLRVCGSNVGWFVNFGYLLLSFRYSRLGGR